MIRRLLRARRHNRAKQQYQTAWIQAQDARRRGDTRALHAAQSALYRATTELLMAEAGR